LSLFIVCLNVRCIEASILWNDDNWKISYTLVDNSFFLIFSRVTIQLVEHKRVLLQASCCQSVCRSVQWVNCGKMADWMWTLFWVVSEVGQGMDVLNGDGDRQMGSGSFQG